MNDEELARHVVDTDGEGLGETQKTRLGVFGDIEEDFRPLKAKFRLQLFDPGALPGAKLPAIAPRRAIAEAVLFEKDG